jgi:alkylation response protein AidB-like acyl-CoA dehydrogenase
MLDGFVAMEMSRVDPSIATFHGVHSGLATGSIALCGSEEQKQRWLPDMATAEKIGAFGLTEPNVGSGTSRGMETTARRHGDEWVLDGEKKWIGNATFADLVVIWARDVADDQVKGFVVEKDTPGFTTEKLEDKIALRVVQNAHIRLTGVRVPEENRLQNANSFRDTAKVLRATRAGVAWMAVGCALGAYENALEYAKTVNSSGARSVASSWCRICSSGCSATRPPRPPSACNSRGCRKPAPHTTSIPPSLRRTARCGCVSPWDGLVSCLAATASCSSTTSGGSSQMPRPSTPTKAPAR